MTVNCGCHRILRMGRDAGYNQTCRISRETVQGFWSPVAENGRPALT